MLDSKDCVWVTVPFTDTDKPLMAPAILKSIATEAGVSSVTIDLNNQFIRRLNQEHSLDSKTQILGFFREETWNPGVLDWAFDCIKDMANIILKYRPKIVGVCVFTYNCRSAAKYLAWVLKKIDPSVKIILGGAGILQHFSGRAKFAEDLKRLGLIDHYVYGDGEKVLFEYLKNHRTNVIGLDSSSWQEMSRSDLESYPMPDYDDYDFTSYAQPLALPINGSRGCVRRCDFCDVHAHWKNYAYRGGENIFQEMLASKEKYNVTFFNFTDSLINGNLKEYRILMNHIADYNKTRPEVEKLKWTSFFILRSQSTFGEDDWRLTSEGGGRYLAVGIETLSDSARKQLGKNFTNQDIEFSFQMAQKYGGIKFVLLFLTGYISETDQDHEYELQWWPKQIKYRDVIFAVNTGTPLGILENTLLSQKFKKYGLISIGPNPEDWVNPATNNTPKKRVQWNNEIVKKVRECGFQVQVGHDAHYILERMRSIDD